MPDLCLVNAMRIARHPAMSSAKQPVGRRTWGGVGPCHDAIFIPLCGLRKGMGFRRKHVPCRGSLPSTRRGRNPGSPELGARLQVPAVHSRPNPLPQGARVTLAALAIAVSLAAPPPARPTRPSRPRSPRRRRPTTNSRSVASPWSPPTRTTTTLPTRGC